MFPHESSMFLAGCPSSQSGDNQQLCSQAPNFVYESQLFIFWKFSPDFLSFWDFMCLQIPNMLTELWKSLTVNIQFFSRRLHCYKITDDMETKTGQKQLQSMQFLLWIHFSSYDLIFMKDAKVFFWVYICLMDLQIWKTHQSLTKEKEKWKSGYILAHVLYLVPVSLTGCMRHSGYFYFKCLSSVIKWLT